LWPASRSSNLPSQQDARAWAEAYATILGDNEVDVRLIADQGDRTLLGLTCTIIAVQ